MMASWQTNQIQSLNPSQDFSLWKTQLPAARFHRSLVGARICFKINEWHRWHCKGGLGGHNRLLFTPSVTAAATYSVYTSTWEALSTWIRRGRSLDRSSCTLSARAEADSKAAVSLQQLV